MTVKTWTTTGIVSALAAAAAFAQPPSPTQQARQYIVDWVMTGVPMEMAMHVSRDGDKQRLDMEMPTMNPSTMQMYKCEQSTIVRPDLQKAWMIVHYKKEYQEKGFNPKLDVTDMRSEASTVEEVGSEVVNGQDCTKYRISTEQGSFNLWMTKNGNVMMKMLQIGGAGYGMEARNLQLTAPPPSTFEVPSDYKEAGGGKGEMAKGVIAGMATGFASSFVPGLGAASGMAQMRQQQAQMKADAEAMAKNCKPTEMPGFMGRGRQGR